MRKFFLLFSLLTCIQDAKAQWTYHHYLIFQNPNSVLGYTHKINDIIFTGNDTGFYSVNSYHPNPPTPHVDPYAYLVRTIDNCNTWQTIQGLSDSYPMALRYLAPHVYYAYTQMGLPSLALYKNGSFQVSLPLSNYNFTDIAILDSMNYFVLDAGLWGPISLSKFQNRVRVSSHPLTNLSPTKIFYPSDTLGFILSSPQIIRYTPTSGYVPVFQDSGRILKSIYFTDSNNGLVGCDSGKFFKTTDAGLTWNLISTMNYYSINAITFVNDSSGYAVGDSGLILKTDDLGITWQLQSSPKPANFEKVQFIDENLGYIYGSLYSSKAIFKTLNGGVTWTGYNPGSFKKLILYPNPASEKFYIKFPDDLKNGTKYTLQILNNLGQIILNRTEIKSDSESEIDLSGNNSGFYIVLVKQEQHIYCNKLVLE